MSPRQACTTKHPIGSCLFIEFPLPWCSASTYCTGMPRQNTSPTDFPPAMLQQISQLAARIVATRKAQGETQAQWADKLGISQPTMARLERGDASVSAATYIMCLWQLNPLLDLTVLLPAATAPDAPAPPAQITAPSQAQGAEASSPADEFAALLGSWLPQR